jgi:hypothetical protein
VTAGTAFRSALQPLMNSTVGHGGFITSCLVHCSAGDAAWTSTKV